MAERTTDDVLADFDNIFPEKEPWDYSVRQRVLERNILYTMGNQWFNEAFQPLYRSSVSTPVSNIIRDYVRSILSLFLSSKYRTRVYPNSEESGDMDAAELGLCFLRWMDERDQGHLENEKELIVLWTVLSGTGFGLVDVAMDTGRFVNGKINKGDIVVESLFPGSVRVPSHGNYLFKKKWVGTMQLKDREWVEDTYKKNIPKESNFHLIAQEKRLLKLASDINQWTGYGLEIDEEDLSEDKVEDLVVFKEVEWKPTKTYSKGRYEAVCGGEVCVQEEKLQLPVSQEGEWFYRVQDFHYNYTPGGFWSSSGVDDLISPQNFINEADQAAMMNFKEFGRPALFTPFGLTTKRISEWGRNFLAVEYDDPLGSGRKPEIVRGTPYPDQLLQMRSLQREMAQDAAGNPKNVLAGKAAHAGASGYLMDTLREVAERSHRPDIERFNRAWAGVKRRCLVLAPKVYTETRMLRIKGAGDKPIVKAFLGAHLHGNTDVRMEEDAGLGATRAGQNAAISEMAKSGFFNEDAMNPELRNHILKTMGLPRPPSVANLHRDRALRENRAVREGVALEKIPLHIGPTMLFDKTTGQVVLDKRGKVVFEKEGIIDPIFHLDDHVAHNKVHDAQILSAEFKTWDKAKQDALLDHRVVHDQEIKLIVKKHKMELAKMAQAKKGPEEKAGFAEEMGPPADEGGGMAMGTPFGGEG